jgi:integrase
VRHVHAVIRSMLEQGMKWGWLTTNPATRATPPKLRRKPIRPPVPDDVLALIAAADPDLACYLRLAAVTGARRGEMCALRWSDLDAFAGTLSITRAVVGRRNDEVAEKSTKTAVGRTIALDKGTIMALLDHRQRCIDRALECDADVADDAFMFSPEPDGSRPWRPDGITLAFGRLRGRLPLKTVRLHDLRHAAATQMLAAGVPVPIVSGRLGHASAATTMSTYAHWIAKGDEAAADVLGDLLGARREGPASDPTPEQDSTATSVAG